MGVPRRFYYTPGRTDLIELSRLLTQPQAEDLLETWDAGEESLAVELLADRLSDGHVAVAEPQRAQLLQLAERHDLAQYVTSSLRWCPDPDAERQPWEPIERTQRAAVVAAELATEIAPGHPLEGKTLAPWLACLACDDVLVMVHAKPKPVLGDLHTFAVIQPTWSGRREQSPWPRTALFAEAVPALERLEACRSSSTLDMRAS